MFTFVAPEFEQDKLGCSAGCDGCRRSQGRSEFNKKKSETSGTWGTLSTSHPPFTESCSLIRSGWNSEGTCWWGRSWAELSWTELSWTELSWAELNWTELSWTELSWAELSWTELSWATDADVFWAEDGLQPLICCTCFEFLERKWKMAENIHLTITTVQSITAVYFCHWTEVFPWNLLHRLVCHHLVIGREPRLQTLRLLFWNNCFILMLKGWDYRPKDVKHWPVRTSRSWGRRPKVRMSMKTLFLNVSQVLVCIGAQTCVCVFVCVSRYYSCCGDLHLNITLWGLLVLTETKSPNNINHSILRWRHVFRLGFLSWVQVAG